MQFLFDNINTKVIDDLKVSIKKGSKLSIASACFSIYAFEELKSQLQNIEELRFIFTAPSFLKDSESKQRREFYIPRIDRERALYGSQFEVKLRNQLTQKAIAIECAEWIRKKVKFKSNITSAAMQGFISVDSDEQATYVPVNGFTTTDLGCEKGINYNEIFEQLQKLNLAIYTPSAFILPSKAAKYQSDIGEGKNGLSLEGREMGIRRLMCILMLKRLESSVNSFRLTLERVEKLIKTTIEHIDNHDSEIDVTEVLDGDLDIEDMENDFVGTKKNRILLEDMDYIQWRSYLQKDYDELELTRLMLADITPEHDSKLQQLICDLRDKFANPVNPGNKKVIIFTAFSDTAVYLYNNLAEPIQQKYGLDSALITGDVEARSTVRGAGKMDFNKVLTLFSPISKEKDVIYPDLNAQIDILIATDCISEGQNLQDCDYLINYDIHWNPVRIIQRFGRIDRIGSKNDVIQLVNYWPDMTLDEYIDLKNRVEARMKVSVMTSTGDDNPISPEEKGDLEYRKAQLKKLQEEVVDIEEMNSGVSIMDLGLNEFRLDLLEYMKIHKDVEHVPYGLHAVVGACGDVKPGVIYVLKNRDDGVNIDKKNRLHPFYLVYIDNEGQILINHLAPKELLDNFRSLCRSKSQPQTTLCKEFNKETGNGFKMDHYSKLLGDAINSIITVKDQSDLDSFLDGSQAELFTMEITGLEDFELIVFLVIK